MRPAPALLDALADSLWQEACRPVPATAMQLAQAVQALYPDGTIAALFLYGSCLRDGIHPDAVTDFYVLVHDWRAIAPDRPIYRIAGAYLPPHVDIRKVHAATHSYAVKLAVMTVQQWQAGMEAFIPTLWGRFAQPVRCLYSDPVSIPILRQGLAHATSRLWQTAPRSGTEEALDIWTAGLSASYRCEWRAERPGRAEDLVLYQKDFYRSLSVPLAGLAPAGHSALTWAKRRILGKTAHILRLIKAGFFVRGGLDYLAWKIERHSGRPVRLSKWERRVPILAGMLRLIRLRVRGQIR